MKKRLPLLCAVVLSLAALSVAVPAAADSIRVFAAASLGGVLEPVAAQWQNRGGAPVSISHAGSSALARQIQQGAPADIFISANSQWMDALESSGDIRASSRFALLTNALVLIAHDADIPHSTIDSAFELGALLGNGTLAMGLVDGVPAGIYGKQALLRLGLWQEVADQVAQTDNVRMALALVARREATLGIVYASDALAEPRVSVIGHFPEGSHDPIIYPAALTSQSAHPQAAAFLDFLASDKARAVFRRAGFEVMDR